MDNAIIEALSPKQKKLVMLRVAYPTASNAALIRAAGYGRGVDTSSGQKVLHSAKVQAAIKALLTETSPGYDQNPRKWIRCELLKEATEESESSSPKRLKALELLGKMTGEFKEKVTVDLTDEIIRSLSSANAL